MIKIKNKEELLELILGMNNKEIGSHLFDFSILQIINQDKYGYVAKVRSMKNNKIYAMKKYDFSKANKNNFLKYCKNEVLFLKQLDHENICKYYTSFNGDNSIYIISEYMDNGNLLSLLNANKNLNEKIKEEKLFLIFLQCMKGLEYIHSKGIIHRGIKPINILMDSNGQIRINDFKMAALDNIEVAKNFAEEQSKRAELVNHMTIVGSGNFMAPEINKLGLSNKIEYDNKIDVYSMGITFCSLAYFQTSLPEKSKNTYSNELYEIIKEMVIEDPKKRPTSKQVYQKLKIEYSKKYLHNTGIISSIKGLTSFPNICQAFFIRRKWNK